MKASNGFDALGSILLFAFFITLGIAFGRHNLDLMKQTLFLIAGAGLLSGGIGGVLSRRRTGGFFIAAGVLTLLYGLI